MFKIKITGIQEAGGLIQEGWPTRIVSFLDTVHEGGQWIEPEANHLITYADDSDRDVQAYGLDYKAPRKDQIERVLAFTADLTDDDIVLIHCHAGISRSTAIAIGICVQHGMGAVEAFEHIESLRSQLYPNTLILQHCDEILNLEGALVEHFKEFAEAKRKTLWTPDAVERNKQEVDAMQKLLNIFKDD